MCPLHMSKQGITRHALYRYARDMGDDLPGSLEVRAERLSGDANHILYQFSLAHGGRCLLEGRAAVVLDAEALQGRHPS